MQLVNDTKSLNRLIKSAHTHGAKFANILHDAAYNTVYHAKNTGDIRPLQALYDGLPVAAALALRLWAVKFGAVNFNVKASKFSTSKKATIDADTLENVGPMAYKKVVAAPVKHTFNLAEEIGKLIERANKHAANGSAVAKLMEAGRLA